MKVWQHKYQILFIILISFWEIALPTYVLIDSLEEMDVFRSPHWETPVQEDLLTDLGKKWFPFGWIVCALVLCQGRKRFNISSPHFITSLPVQKTSLLRCQKILSFHPQICPDCLEPLKSDNHVSMQYSGGGICRRVQTLINL